MISLNDEKILDDCLYSIRKQDYRQDLIKIILVDGGSTDNTVNIARKYDAEVIIRPDLKDFPNIRGGMALTAAKSDFILFMSADNRLQENDVLSAMVRASSHQEIVACETLRYGFHQTDPALSRYFALIGGADPIAVGLGKADRGPYDRDGWHGYGEVMDCGFYYEVSFQKDVTKIPTLGANGFLIKRSFLDRTTLAQNCLHIDMCVELILQGHNKFAFLKNAHVIHFLDLKLLSFLKRRLLYANMYHSDHTKRIYFVFHKSEFLKLIIISLCNLTMVIPLLRAISGYLHKKDIAWFLHPIVCFVFTVGYSLFFVKKTLMNAGRKL
jgi:glycosyltransferase involved in cell wall biosynthesis